MNAPTPTPTGTAPAPTPPQTPTPSPSPAPTGTAPAPTPGPTPTPSPTATPGAPYKPEGIPEHLAGANDKETIDKLNAAVQGFRKDLSKKGVPETADKYELKVPDDLKDKIFKFGADGKDPVFEGLKPTLHKHGLSNEAATELTLELYKQVSALAGGQPVDPGSAADFGFKELGGAEKAKPVQEGANAWINGMEQTKKLDAKAAAELRLLTQYGEGLHLVDALRVLSGEKPIPAQLQGNPQGGPTKAEIDARVSDPRYHKPGVKDEAFINETTRLYQEFFAKQGAS